MKHKHNFKRNTILFSLFLFSLFLSNQALSQIPFESKTVVRYRSPSSLFDTLKNYNSKSSLKKVGDLSFLVDTLSADNKAVFFNKADSLVASQKKNNESVEMFDQITTSIVISDNAENFFPTINGDVVRYKLGVYSKIKKNTDESFDTIRTYLPLNMITKVSGNYKTVDAGTLNDATSFFGAPLTFRVSPSFKINCGAENTLVIGTIQDLRLFTVGDTSNQKLEAAFGYYGSAGLTYFGNGKVFDVDNSEHEGNWSFSALIYWFKSGGKFNKAVFGDYEKKTLSGAEFLLKFTPFKKEASKFGFLIGADNSFTRGTPNFAKWNFRIGIGN